MAAKQAAAQVGMSRFEHVPVFVGSQGMITDNARIAYVRQAVICSAVQVQANDTLQSLDQRAGKVSAKLMKKVSNKVQFLQSATPSIKNCITVGLLWHGHPT